MADDEAAEQLTIEGRAVSITHPSKLYFAAAGLTKLDVVRYYLAVADGALRGIRGRPLVLKRFVNGAGGEAFYQKRAPSTRPDWLQTVTLKFPSGRTAEEVTVDDAAGLAWVANLGCLELHPHPVRSGDLEHPDELRVDLDPGPGVEFDAVRQVALEVKRLLEELGLRGWPKTSGSRGIHVLVRIAPRWTFDEVRRAALALSREIERRVPKLATSKWWKEERHGVFLDYNQNAKDRTTASAYSVRPLPDARVSTPLDWQEVAACEPERFTVFTVPQRFAEIGDPHAGIDEHVGSLERLLELARQDESAGLGDAPWPPHHVKRTGEPARVAPSKRRSAEKRPPATRSDAAQAGALPAATGRRRASQPLVVVARAWSQADALAGLERWKLRHPQAASHVEKADVLVDSLRGRSTTWTRVRINLRNVPEPLRPPQETPDPDDAGTAADGRKPPRNKPA